MEASVNKLGMVRGWEKMDWEKKLGGSCSCWGLWVIVRTFPYTFNELAS